MTSNYGGTRGTGFSEVQFNSLDVPISTPEPGSILGLLAVGGGLLASRRKKQG